MYKVSIYLLAVVLIFVLSLPGSWAFFQPGYFANHDGAGHIIRLQEFDISLRDGQFPPRMSKNLMYGYGFYFFNFNYPLIYWSGEVAHWLGLGFTNSIKAVTVFTFILSGIGMFFWQKRMWGFWGGLTAAVFYMYAPYRMVNMYVRGSIAEHIAFVMMPFLFLFTEKVVEGKKSKKIEAILWGGIAYGFLMVSHNIMAFIFTLMLGLFMLFHIVLYKKIKLVLSFFSIGAIGLALSSFFWVPALLEKKYVRLDQTIGQDYPNHFIYLFQIWKRSWGYGASVAGPNDGLSFQVGVFHLIAFALSFLAILILWRKRKSKEALHVGFYIFVFLLSVFFMLPISSFVWQHLPLLKFTQFPWRFLSWSIFATSVLAGAVIYTATLAVPFGRRLSGPLLSMAAIFFLLYTSQEYWQPNVKTNVNLSGDQPIAGSTTWADEQFPIWFTPKPKEFPKNHVGLASGDAVISIQSWKTGEHIYDVNVIGSKARIVENVAYYPGWQVAVDGKKYNFSYQDFLFPGRIVYDLFQGNHKIKTTFSENTERLIFDFFSLVSLILVVLGLFSINFLKKFVKLE